MKTEKVTSQSETSGCYTIHNFVPKMDEYKLFGVTAQRFPLQGKPTVIKSRYAS